MTWTAIDPQNVNTILDAATLNLLKTNLDHLAQPPLDFYAHSTSGGDYTTTNISFLEAIDATNMRLSVTLTGGIAMCLLQIGTLYSSNTTQTPAFGVSVDQNFIGRHGDFSRLAGPKIYTNSAGLLGSINIWMPVFNLPAGTHDIEPVWAAGNGSATTCTLVDGDGIFWGVWEL